LLPNLHKRNTALLRLIYCWIVIFSHKLFMLAYFDQVSTWKWTFCKLCRTLYDITRQKTQKLLCSGIIRPHDSRVHSTKVCLMATN